MMTCLLINAEEGSHNFGSSFFFRQIAADNEYKRTIHSTLRNNA